MKLCLTFFLISCILSAVICKSCNGKCGSKVDDWSKPNPTDSSPTTEHRDTLVEFTKVGGLNFIPKPENTLENNTLIRYNPDNASYFRKSMQQYYEKYTTNLENTVDCKHIGRADKTRACVFKWEEFYSCGAPDFGFKNDSVCVFLELDKVENWQPQYYDTTSTMPEEMTYELQWEIDRHRSSQHDQVWVDCIAKDENGKVYSVGLSQFGFESIYFPYTNVKGYHNPVVPVFFAFPRSCAVYDFVCRAWAKNLNHEKNQGVVNFQVFFDKNCTTKKAEMEN